jgi:hypothetical protein
MKKKIIGIFVCLLMLTTLIIPVVAITNKYETKTTSYNADVPIWEKGDEWTYLFTQSTDIELPDFFATYTFSGELTFEVVDDSDDSYILEAKTKPLGSFDLGVIEFKTTRFTYLTMRLNIRKVDLGLEHYKHVLRGILKLKVGPITIPFPIQILFDLNVEIDPTWNLIPFPLYDGKHGNLNSTEFWHYNCGISLFWGLIPLFKMNNSWPVSPIPYTCSQEQITVEAGIFDVYNVSAEWTDGSRFESYYCEEVGNVVKEIIYIPLEQDLKRYYLNLELKDWSNTP